MRFPYRIKFRRAQATIYSRTEACPFYRLSYYVAGERRVEKFKRFAEALSEAEKKVRQLAVGNQVSALTSREVADCLAVKGALAEFRRDMHQDVSLLGCVTSHLAALRRLHGKPLGEVLDAYINSLAVVRPQDVGVAVREYLDARQALTKSSNGDRPQLSAKYLYQVQNHLSRFAQTFPNTAVCELTKAHIDQFFTGLVELTPKSRNHYRASIKQFCDWARRKDYLAGSNRLAEADSMRPERANTAEVEIYAANEFRALLQAADDELRPMLALGGLCGLRTAELLRLDWHDLWHVAGHVEVSRAKSKTRSRRLVPICSALETWLAPYRTFTSGSVWPWRETEFQERFLLLCEKIGVPRKPNGLRHTFASAALVLHGENEAAQWAGHSPSMLHQSYKGLLTKAEAEKWFAVAPAQAENILPMPATKAVAP